MPAGKKRGAGDVDLARIESLIEDATVDCYNETEQAVGLFVTIQDHLHLPFTTRILGMEVAVVAVEQGDDDSVVAVCERDGERQRIPLLDLPLPSPPPEGVEWIAAYRHWARHH